MVYKWYINNHLTFTHTTTKHTQKSPSHFPDLPKAFGSWLFFELIAALSIVCQLKVLTTLWLKHKEKLSQLYVATSAFIVFISIENKAYIFTVFTRLTSNPNRNKFCVGKTNYVLFVVIYGRHLNT